MNKHDLPHKLAAIANTDKIDSYDVYTLRREFLADDFISQQEATNLFVLDSIASEKCREWGYFFSEAMVDYTVNQFEPAGEVNAENANWLMDQISTDGIVKSPEQMEALVKILETAKFAPNSLIKFALDQVAHAVLNNQGPLAESRDAATCVICKSDVELIRRLMYGFASDGGAAVSRDEAEFLFDLNDKTIECENDPAWSDLFMRAVGNYLLFTMNNSVPERRVALAEDSWDMNSDSTIASMVGKLRSVFRETISMGEQLEEGYERNNAAYEAAAHKAAEVTSEEAEWVVQRIGADGVLHDNEKALLRFLKEESPNMHPSLKELVDQAA